MKKRFSVKRYIVILLFVLLLPAELAWCLLLGVLCFVSAHLSTFVMFAWKKTFEALDYFDDILPKRFLNRNKSQ